MKPEYTDDGLWAITLNGEPALVNVVGTYGNRPDPVVYVEDGLHKGFQLVIDWETGRIIRNLTEEVS